MELNEKQKHAIFLLNGLYGVTVKDEVIERKREVLKELIKGELNLRQLLEAETKPVFCYTDTDIETAYQIGRSKALEDARDMVLAMTVYNNRKEVRRRAKEAQTGWICGIDDALRAIESVPHAVNE